jgi:two-component system, OmpR family, phosphate regulon sensor histidine kinase PhoR
MKGWPFWVSLLAIAILAFALFSVAGPMAGVLVAAVGFLVTSLAYGLKLQAIARMATHPDQPFSAVDSNDDVVRALVARDQALERRLTLLTQQVIAMQESLDLLPEAVVVLDQGQRILWSNNTARTLLAIDRDRDRLEPLSLRLRSLALIEAMQSHFVSPLRMAAPANADRMLQFQGLRSAGDNWLLIATDITESNRVETMRRDFIANLSHELKTPLTVLAGFVETLQEEAEIPAAQITEALGHMRTQSDAMQRLVMDLLTLSRLESTDASAPSVPMDLRAVQRQVVHDALALSAGRHQFKVEDMEAITVLGSEEEIASAMRNLLANAVQYTPAGGQIRLQITRRVDRGLDIAVRDSGIGIAKEHIARLTERFYRIDRSRSRATGGTGLGLAIVKHIAQRHGGQLVIDSAPGAGSTFTLKLPALRVRA